MILSGSNMREGIIHTKTRLARC